MLVVLIGFGVSYFLMPAINRSRDGELHGDMQPRSVPSPASGQRGHQPDPDRVAGLFEFDLARLGKTLS